MQGEVASLQEVQEEIQDRKKTIRQRLNDDPFGSKDTLDSEGYTEICDQATSRSDGITGGPIDLDKIRKIKIYNLDNPKTTEFFSLFPPKIILGALISYTKEKKLKLEVSPNTYKLTMTISSENGNQFTFVAQILKVLTRQKIAEMRSKFTDGDESSDSDGLYENPDNLDQKEEEKGEEVNDKQIYCVEL